MNQWTMVDSSSWIHALRRKGDVSVRARVQHLLDNRMAAWCEMVRLELWTGVRNDDERRALEVLDKTLPRMPITNNVWSAAVNYGSRARAAGLTVLIFACAKEYGLSIEHKDRHYELLDALK